MYTSRYFDGYTTAGIEEVVQAVLFDPGLMTPF